MHVAVQTGSHGREQPVTAGAWQVNGGVAIAFTLCLETRLVVAQLCESSVLARGLEREVDAEDIGDSIAGRKHVQETYFVAHPDQILRRRGQSENNCEADGAVQAVCWRERLRLTSILGAAVGGSGSRAWGAAAAFFAMFGDVMGGLEMEVGVAEDASERRRSRGERAS